MIEWIGDHQGVLWIVGAASVAILIASLVFIPALVVRIRPDYFTHDQRPQPIWANQRPVVRVAIQLGKNVLGAVLMLAGIAMLALPGQGVLTMLVGFFLVDFPGKYRMEKWLVSRRSMLGLINWFRRRAGRIPLQVK